MKRLELPTALTSLWLLSGPKLGFAPDGSLAISFSTIQELTSDILYETSRKVAVINIESTSVGIGQRKRTPDGPSLRLGMAEKSALYRAVGELHGALMKPPTEPKVREALFVW